MREQSLFSARFCHPERSEGSAVRRKMQIPRFARDDNSLMKPEKAVRESWKLFGVGDGN